MLMNKNTYRVGIYTRLSIDDGTNEESVSIDTQKKILSCYKRFIKIRKKLYRLWLLFRDIFSRTSSKIYCSK